MKLMTPVLIPTLCACLFVGCVTAPPPKSGLELQSFQRREFETTKKVAFASTLSVLQDLGYVVNSADLETGFITAKSPTDGKAGFFSNTMRDTKATAFVEELRPGHSSIRLTFLDSKEKSDSHGAKLARDVPIESPEFYAKVFERIKQAVFVRAAVQ